jgi:hypothetical protein
MSIRGFIRRLWGGQVNSEVRSEQSGGDTEPPVTRWHGPHDPRRGPACAECGWQLSISYPPGTKLICSRCSRPLCIGDDGQAKRPGTSSDRRASDRIPAGKLTRSSSGWQSNLPKESPVRREQNRDGDTNYSNRQSKATLRPSYPCCPWCNRTVSQEYPEGTRFRCSGCLGGYFLDEQGDTRGTYRPPSHGISGNVTKKIFVAATTCRVKGWFTKNGELAPEMTEGDRLRIEQGREVGVVARTLYQGSVLVDDANPDVAAHVTWKMMQDQTIAAICEATFIAEGYVARADVLARNGNGWDVIEVKMNLEGTSRLPELVDDLAYTTMVAQQSGVDVRRTFLLLLSREYRMGMPLDRLFVEVDQTDEVRKRVQAFLPLWDVIWPDTASRCVPEAKLIGECRTCEYCRALCLGRERQHPVLTLPRLRTEKLIQLGQMGIHELNDVPADFELSELQKRVVECVRSQRPFVGVGLHADLDRIQWPAHYLDFETTTTAVPLYPDLPPFHQLTTQYSIHHCSSLGQIMGHSEYLADPRRDCERGLAEQLLRDLGTAGSIIVYSGFEKTRITALAARFPDLSRRLLALNERLWDLCAVLQCGYYHPAFDGSFSIKNTLPVLVPAMNYDGMEIGDGDTASVRFARMAMGQYTDEEAHQVLHDLKAYCAQDTLAMVRMHERLAAIADGRAAGIV